MSGKRTRVYVAVVVVYVAVAAGLYLATLPARAEADELLQTLSDLERDVERVEVLNQQFEERRESMLDHAERLSENLEKCRTKRAAIRAEVGAEGGR